MDEHARRTREEISRLLAERGVHLTTQRIAIAEFVLSRTDHPSAEAVYQAVSAELPVVSKATVYNTLNLLVSKGLLQALPLQEGGVRYDPNVAPHAHFFDTRTNRLFDVPADQVRPIEHRLDPNRFEVEQVHVIFRGRIRYGHPAGI